MKDLTGQYVIKRANPDSPFGKANRDLAFAVDAHGCLLYLCEKTENPHEIVPVKVNLCSGGDLPFDRLYGDIVSGEVQLIKERRPAMPR